MHSQREAMKVTSTSHRLRSFPRLGIVTHSRFTGVMGGAAPSLRGRSNARREPSASRVVVGALGRLDFIDSAGALLSDLHAALGPDRASAEPLELALYGRDAGVAEGRAAAVCFPRAAHEVAAAVRVARRHGRPFVARGSGTGLAGGATPLDDPLVIVTTQMDRVLEIDAEARTAWVEPGVLNLDLSRAVAHLGLHYAPDPSSQQACTIGGNVGTNAGGPHCLADGVTSAHVLAVDVVLADGTIARLGGLEPDTP